MSSHEPTMTGTKICTKCERKLPVICFPVRKSSKDGLHENCRECTRDRIKQKRSSMHGVSHKQLAGLRAHHNFHNDE
jgi:hypothetical protein